MFIRKRTDAASDNWRTAEAARPQIAFATRLDVRRPLTSVGRQRPYRSLALIVSLSCHFAPFDVVVYSSPPIVLLPLSSRLDADIKSLEKSPETNVPSSGFAFRATMFFHWRPVLDAPCHVSCARRVNARSRCFSLIDLLTYAFLPLVARFYDGRLTRPFRRRSSRTFENKSNVKPRAREFADAQADDTCRSREARMTRGMDSYIIACYYIGVHARGHRLGRRLPSEINRRLYVTLFTRRYAGRTVEASAL
jgi:hypothetical protein